MHSGCRIRDITAMLNIRPESHISPHPDISQFGCSDRGYARPSGRPRVFLRLTQDKLTLRRTFQVRFEFESLRLPGTRRKRLRCAWHVHLHGLVTQNRETSGLSVGNLRRKSSSDCSSNTILDRNHPNFDQFHHLEIELLYRPRHFPEYLHSDRLCTPGFFLSCVVK
jgi:hypothetical protein